jgi:hypothetical protein
VLHDGTSVVSFVLWITAMGLAGWRWRRQGYGRVSLALGAVALVSFVTLGAIREADPGSSVGLVQRLMLTAVGAWFATTAFELRRRPRSQD